MRLASCTVLQQNGDIGLCLYIGETNSVPLKSECHQHWIPRGSDTSARPREWLGPIGVLCQVLEARKNLVGRIRIIWKGENGVTATTTLFLHANSRLHLGTLSHLASWNKPIHGRYLLQFAIVAPVLPTCANTLDWSRHFEPGTFLNKHHYRDVWHYTPPQQHN